jgi:putative ATPase
LFPLSSQLTSSSSPLAHRSRPEKLSEFIGSDQVFTRYPFLKQKHLPNLIIYGPPGSGKTTFAKLISQESGKIFHQFNAVLGGVADLKKLIHSIGPGSVIFIDEIHRFNKAQQDALLPYIEEGTFVLIGATTEYPKVSVNRALLSRSQIIELKELSNQQILKLLQNVQAKFSLTLSPVLLETISKLTGGDARIALNTLELALTLDNPTEEQLKKMISENNRAYDKNGNRHYDVISGFIKSMRANDPQKALLCLAIMIDGNEDPLFIARRLVIFASEDVGNADPSALTLATSALLAVKNIGMPEARIILSQATTYLASTYKSRASYEAINEAVALVEANASINPFTHHIKNDFYLPTSEGREDGIKKRLEQLKKTK